jgi:hypothetical protein
MVYFFTSKNDVLLYMGKDKFENEGTAEYFLLKLELKLA